MKRAETPMSVLGILTHIPKRVLVVSALASVVSGLTSGALLAVVRSATDSRVAATTALPRFVGLLVVFGVSYLISQLSLVAVSEVTFSELRFRLCQQILRAPLPVLEQLGAGRILNVVSDDLAVMVGGVTVIPTGIVNVGILLSCLAYLTILSPFVLGMFALSAVVAIGVGQLFATRASRALTSAAKVRRELFQSIAALISGAKELRLNRNLGKDFMENTIAPTTAALFEQARTGSVAEGATKTIHGLFVWLFIGLTAFYFPHAHPEASRTLVAEAMIVALFTMTPMGALLGVVQQLVRSNIAAKAVAELGLQLPAAEIVSSGLVPEPPAFSKSIELRGIVHRYYRERENDLFALGPIDLEIVPGEILFIIGGNGSGKSTLMKVLSGLYAPESGQVLLDDKPIGPQDLEEYRQQFVGIFTDFHVFDRLVGIRNEDVDEKSTELLTRFQLEHKVRVRDRVLSTVDLSQGQRKRLALVAACLQDRPVYIFDEWAADQDPLFKEIFYKSILPGLKARGKTCIVVSHDDRYFACADRLIRLESGQVSAIDAPPA